MLCEGWVEAEPSLLRACGHEHRKQLIARQRLKKGLLRSGWCQLLGGGKHRIQLCHGGGLGGDSGSGSAGLLLLARGRRRLRHGCLGRRGRRGSSRAGGSLGVSSPRTNDSRLHGGSSSGRRSDRGHRAPHDSGPVLIIRHTVSTLTSRARGGGRGGESGEVGSDRDGLGGGVINRDGASSSSCQHVLDVVGERAPEDAVEQVGEVADALGASAEMKRHVGVDIDLLNLARGAQVVLVAGGCDLQLQRGRVGVLLGLAGLVGLNGVAVERDLGVVRANHRIARLGVVLGDVVVQKAKLARGCVVLLAAGRRALLDQNLEDQTEGEDLMRVVLKREKAKEVLRANLAHLNLLAKKRARKLIELRLKLRDNIADPHVVRHLGALANGWVAKDNYIT